MLLLAQDCNTDIFFFRETYYTSIIFAHKVIKKTDFEVAILIITSVLLGVKFHTIG